MIWKLLNGSYRVQDYINAHISISTIVDCAAIALSTAGVIMFVWWFYFIKED